jgi:hypothetical protein
MMTSNVLNYVSLMQKHATNTLMAEGNRIASDGIAETKAERAERRERYYVEQFHGMTCDALAVGLSVTCAATVYFGWHEITLRYGELATRCGGIERVIVGSNTAEISWISLATTPFRVASYARCVASQGARAVLGFLLVALVAASLTKLDVARKFRSTPMFVLTAILGIGVGALGSRAIVALGGDRDAWLLAWRLYVAAVASCTASSSILAPLAARRTHVAWLYLITLGVFAPLTVAYVAFACAGASARSAPPPPWAPLARAWTSAWRRTTRRAPPSPPTTAVYYAI